jgi:hypothetical protein
LLRTWTAEGEGQLLEQVAANGIEGNVQVVMEQDGDEELVAIIIETQEDPK